MGSGSAKLEEPLVYSDEVYIEMTKEDESDSEIPLSELLFNFSNIGYGSA